MPELERRGQTAVTLPMADVLAEARLPSPWDGLSGQADFDHALARGIDELDPLQRVRACNRIAAATPQERCGLIAIATYGWSTWVSYESLAQDLAIKLKDFSKLMARLKRKELVRETVVHLSGGRRLRFIIISGDHLLRAFRPAVSLVPPAGEDGPEQAEIPQAEISSAVSRFPPAQLGAGGNFDPQAEISTPITLVSSYICKQDSEKQLTDVPGGPNQRAVSQIPPAPFWWERWTAHVGRIPAPTPRPVKWTALASLLDPELDPDADILREACARFLEAYSQPRHAPVRSLRAVVRSIYQGLLLELGGGVGPAPVFYATEVWFAEEPEQPELMPERQYGPFPWEAVADAEAVRIWAVVLDELRDRLPRPTFETWIRPTRGVALDGDTFTVTTPSPFAVEWLERRMFHELQRSLGRVAGRPLELLITSLRIR